MVRRLRLLFIFVSVCILLAGCVHTPDAPTVPTSMPTQENRIETITVYSINSDSQTLVPVSVRKGKEKISEKYIVSLVLNNLMEYQINPPVIKKKGNKLYLSFSSEGEPVKNCNKKLEKLILECFANSLIDNIETCHDIIFQVDGKAYKSDNLEFGQDEIYLSR